MIETIYERNHDQDNISVSSLFLPHGKGGGSKDNLELDFIW